MLSALLIHVGTVTEDDVVQDCEFLNALIIGFDFSERQGATAHDVTKTGRNASLKHTVWLNDRTFGKTLEFATATSCATLNRSLAVGEAFTVAYGKLSVCCLDGSVIALNTGKEREGRKKNAELHRGPLFVEEFKGLVSGGGHGPLKHPEAQAAFYGRRQPLKRGHDEYPPRGSAN